jgi:hypothetical protein
VERCASERVELSIRHHFAFIPNDMLQLARPTYAETAFQQLRLSAGRSPLKMTTMIPGVVPLRDGPEELLTTNAFKHVVADPSHFRDPRAMGVSIAN